MRAVHLVQPTLWRTCRAIANRTRLQVFRLLVRQPSQTVSDVATRLGRPLSLTSEYLRTLEARGLLIARRVSRRVIYRLNPATDGGPAPKLVAALRSALQCEVQPLETLFNLATAFTHPRRIEIFRVLHAKPRTRAEVQVVTGISSRAVQRHLKKLQARHFVTRKGGVYAVARCPHAFGRELARIAIE
jgi:DNA-binding transcriptional ArsR family regulator